MNVVLKIQIRDRKFFFDNTQSIPPLPTIQERCILFFPFPPPYFQLNIDRMAPHFIGGYQNSFLATGYVETLQLY